MTKTQKKLWTGLIIMAILSPIGIILPAKFNSGDAWGEWGTETLKKLLGYVPEGLKKHTDIWRAPVQDYNMGGDTAPMVFQIISYIVSGLIGILVVGLVIYFISKVLVKNEK
jgi:cobalt/nickel transport protein